MTRLSQKQAGAYYTPERVVSRLVRWAVRDKSDRLLNPSCGDGHFIASHRNSFRTLGALAPSGTGFPGSRIRPEHEARI